MRVLILLSALTACAGASVGVASRRGFAQSVARPASRVTSRVTMAARTALIAGNWKMNTVLSEAVALAKVVADASQGAAADVTICVPFPYLDAVSRVLAGSKVGLGAQDVCEYDKGAYTGGVSTAMLQSVGCSYVLTGHSERRAIFGESDELINKKTRKVLAAGLKCILCVGELKEQREDGSTDQVVATQLVGGLKGVSEAELANIVIAYEPVWAIGTGLTATPEQAQETHAAVRKWFAANYSPAAAEKMVIQYGGSVTPDTVDELMSCPDIDGALVGGASLIGDKFARIINFVV
ncbi:Triosephosphate isomerase [Pavlovales sp. CCMP2436]|nr:Triosephosphate isomerase [Pavlovales sp. CCMP2436]